MARRTDQGRIINLEDATMQMVVEKGYASASVSEIARQAGVSAGYLYRHHLNKEELVRSIYDKYVKVFDNHIDMLLDESDDLRSAIYGYVSFMFLNANENPRLAKFLHLLVYEPKFDIPKLRMKATRDQCVKMLIKGIKSGEVRTDMTPEDMYIIFFSIPFKLLEVRMEGSMKKGLFSEADTLRVTDLCMRAAG